MGNDVYVKSIQLLRSYQSSFSRYASSFQHGVYNYWATLGHLEEHAKQCKSHMHDLVVSRKHALYGARIDLVQAMSEKPPVPHHIANATKKLDGCKKAYEIATQYDEQCDKMLKTLRARIEQARHQSTLLLNKFNNTVDMGSHFLSGYLMKLESYMNQNG